jgi:hypothetical protein
MKCEQGKCQISDENMTAKINDTLQTEENQTTILNESLAREKRPISKHSVVSVSSVNKLPNSFPSKKDQSSEQKFDSVSLNKTTARSHDDKLNANVSIDVNEQNFVTSDSGNKNIIKQRKSNAFGIDNVIKVKKSSDDDNIRSKTSTTKIISTK